MFLPISIPHLNNNTFPVDDWRQLKMSKVVRAFQTAISSIIDLFGKLGGLAKSIFGWIWRHGRRRS